MVYQRNLISFVIKVFLFFIVITSSASASQPNLTAPISHQSDEKVERYQWSKTRRQAIGDSTYKYYIFQRLLETSDIFGRAQQEADEKLLRGMTQSTHIERAYKPLLPTEPMLMILDYCEDMFVTAFKYRDLIFTLLLPSDDKDHSAYQERELQIIEKEPKKGYLSPRVIVYRNDLKWYISKETGFNEEELKTRTLGNYVFWGGNDQTQNTKLSIQIFTYDQVWEKDHFFLTNLFTMDDAQQGDKEWYTIFAPQALCYDLWFDATSSKYKLRDQLSPIMTTLNINNIEDLDVTCRDCGLPIPKEQEVGRLACVYVDSNRFNNGCKKITRRCVVVKPRIRSSPPSYDFLVERVNTLKMENDVLRDRNDILSSENNALIAKSDGLIGENRGLKKAKDVLMTENGILRSRNDTVEGENNILKKDRDTFMGSNSDLRSKNHDLTTRNHTLSEENSGLRRSNATLMAENETLKSSKRTVEDKKNILKKKNTKLRRYCYFVSFPVILWMVTMAFDYFVPQGLFISYQKTNISPCLGPALLRNNVY